MRRRLLVNSVAMSVCAFTQTVGAHAQDADELAKQLSNPIANLISVPIQSN